MDRGTWQATVNGVAKSWPQLSISAYTGVWWALNIQDVLYLWRGAWHPAPAFLPGESYVQRNLVGYSP